MYIHFKDKKSLATARNASADADAGGTRATYTNAASEGVGAELAQAAAGTQNGRYATSVLTSGGGQYWMTSRQERRVLAQLKVICRMLV